MTALLIGGLTLACCLLVGYATEIYSHGLSEIFPALKMVLKQFGIITGVVGAAVVMVFKAPTETERIVSSLVVFCFGTFLVPSAAYVGWFIARTWSYFVGCEPPTEPSPGCASIRDFLRQIFNLLYLISKPKTSNRLEV
ncbi:MAG: hypothetical protein R3B53_00075 [Candidatus Paceibacterota bacterium]